VAEVAAPEGRRATHSGHRDILACVPQAVCKLMQRCAKCQDIIGKQRAVCVHKTFASAMQHCACFWPGVQPEQEPCSKWAWGHNGA